MNDFFQLLKYCKVKELHMSESEALDLLQHYHCFSNDHSYNAIDFEKLLLMEFKFQDNPKVMSKIQELKEKVVLNYVTRKQLIARLCSKVIN